VCPCLPTADLQAYDTFTSIFDKDAEDDTIDDEASSADFVTELGKAVAARLLTKDASSVSLHQCSDGVETVETDLTNSQPSKESIEAKPKAPESVVFEKRTRRKTRRPPRCLPKRRLPRPSTQRKVNNNRRVTFCYTAPEKYQCFYA
jgi:hypothetical protein